MAKQYFNPRNIKFLLHEWLKASELNRLSYYQDYDREAFDMAMEAAKQIGDQHLFPYYTVMDKEKAYHKDGVVYTHEGLEKGIKAIAEGGWISAHATYEEGGQQMPFTLMNAGLFIFYAANANTAAYAFLTQGAANLIRSFGSDALKEKYIPKMFAGEWQGTMALTEPQAGSSLSDLTSTATPQADGTYKIKGQKIYISGGDHSAVDNVVHLTLARIEGAPAGTKGISLFVVPKHRGENGSLTSNDVLTSGIYGKMGQKGYVAAHLMMGENDDCVGYLVGKPHHGLRYMFQMMNEARIGTGNVSAGNATAAYYASLQYANERPQGRHPGQKDMTLPQVLIIEHADVRRMLLFQKAVVEASQALVLLSSYWADLAEYGEGQEKEEGHLLLELITPIVKSFPAEYGNQSVSAGIQVLGGAGYTDDFPLEQYYRDIRVNAIYEGTTTIHGMDLLGRKVMLQEGKALTLLLKKIKASVESGVAEERLSAGAALLGERAKALHTTTMHLVQIAMKENPRVFLSDATLYLEFFSLITVGWIWLDHALIATEQLKNENLPDSDRNFYEGKVYTANYFFEYELPKTKALEQRLLSKDTLTLDLENEYLN
jgi:alkylation response protein AidB-like acyl-CoA dehydrogenase